MRAAMEAPYPLYFRKLGENHREPLLLLHGITGSGRYWLRVAPGLSSEFTVLMPDLLGFGDSPKPDEVHPGEFQEIWTRVEINCPHVALEGLDIFMNFYYP